MNTDPLPSLRAREQERARNQKWITAFLVLILVATVVSIGLAVFAVIAQKSVDISPLVLILIPALWLGVFAVLGIATMRDKSTVLLEQARSAQLAFLVERGVEVPKGSLEALSFPNSPPTADGLFGSATLLRRGEAVTAVLKFEQGEFVLYGDDGRELSPLPAELALA